MITLLLTLWWICGCASFYFFFTRNNDLTLGWAIAGFLNGLVGIFGWLIFWLVYRAETKILHPEKIKPIILIKRNR